MEREDACCQWNRLTAGTQRVNLRWMTETNNVAFLKKEL